MVLSKTEYAEKYGRWVEDNEIVIEDLTELELKIIAKKLAGVGYHVEYWKCPKQESGHLHIKDIQFPKEIELTNVQLRQYKYEVMKKYIPQTALKKVDLNFIKQKRHRIAEENKPHFKGYGVKQLVKELNKGNINNCEKELLEKVLNRKHGSKEEQVVITQNLELKTYLDYKKLKKNKNYIVEDFLYPESVNMIYSPPASFKSLLLQYLSLCLANGKDWLGFKTKKTPVLYLDGENSDLIIKERLEQIHSGMNLKRNNFPFYILKGGELINQAKKVNIGFLASIEEEIKQKGIKVLIFDTLHRFAYYDENKSDDINLLYTKVFKPLVENYKVSIIFLHHSRKDGGYRGSGDFLGSVDVSYRINRKGKTNSFTIVNEKCRSGEIENITGEILFEENCIQFFKKSFVEETETKIQKLKDVTNRIHELLEIGSEMKRKEIIECLQMEKFDFGDIKSVTRALKFLVDTGKFDKTERGIYRRLK